MYSNRDGPQSHPTNMVGVIWHSDMQLLTNFRVPPNVKFEIDDTEQTWTWDDNFFDLVHMRTMTGCIRNWDKLFAQAFQ